MVKQKLMSDAAGAGAKAITGGLEAAGTSALGTGAMTGMATAIPYVGAGLMAGKMLGLFNEGGMVGPLSAQYNAQGTMSKEQAMALMNNQPEPIPMPMMRP